MKKAPYTDRKLTSEEQAIAENGMIYSAFLIYRR